MNSEVSGKGENNEKLENGFNTLDLAKHAARTIIETMRPVDRLSIIAYDNQ